MVAEGTMTIIQGPYRAGHISPIIANNSLPFLLESMTHHVMGILNTVINTQPFSKKINNGYVIPHMLILIVLLLPKLHTTSRMNSLRKVLLRINSVL